MIEIIDKVTHNMVFQKGSKTLYANHAYPAHIELSVERTGDPLIFRSYLNNQLNAQLIFDLTDDGELYCTINRDVKPSMYVCIALMDVMNRFEGFRYYFEGGVNSISYLAYRIFWMYQKYRIERILEG